MILLHNSNRLRYILITFLCVFIFSSFWMFSRFTVDDAFISWRYGKNIFDFGIWNYNPSNFDMTQAYTNPIFAFLSIIPNLFRLDIVLFFKIVALISLIIFLLWFNFKAKNSLIMVLMFLAIPATFIHVFSGLETFLFVVLLSIFFIFLYEDKFYCSIFTALFLLFTRPEMWMLSVLLPIYFLASNLDKKTSLKNYGIFYQLKWKECVLSFLFLSIPLILYLIFNEVHFGDILPNTFYVKSGKYLSINRFIFMALLTLPILILIPLKKKLLFSLSLLMLGAMIIVYSTSDLQMDYAERFSFHIFAPVYFFVVYIAAKNENKFAYICLDSDLFKFKKSMKLSDLIKIFLLPFFFLFAGKIMVPSALVFISNYYPRAIDSHAEFGKTLCLIKEKYGLKSFSFGDAGMAAYHSKLIALDNIGLGSHAVATSGVTSELLNKYSPDIIAFYSTPEGIRLDDHNQKIIYEWALSNGMKMICDIYWNPSYIVRIFSRNTYPEIVDLCNYSERKNNKKDKLYFLQTGLDYPWFYWKE